MTLINWVIISLILSIIGNICCIWYIRRLLSKVLFISENLTDLVDVLDTYRNHLKKIYSLEMFHGDETIQFLIRHTNSLLDILEDYRDIYQMTDPLEITNSQEEEEEYDEETQRAEPSTKRMYFTAVHEAAIVEYCSSECNERKSELYVEFIQPTFNEMVDKIVYSYHFTSLANIDDLRSECKAWLITILDKFDPAKGSKAFSYFSVVTKNWFIHKVKKQTKRCQREIEYDLVAQEVYEKQVQPDSNYLSKREKDDFWLKLWEEIDSWGTNDMRDNEKKVYEAIRIILSSADDIDIFNKKAVYLYLRELTGLNTKQIVTQLNKMREKYRDFKDDWNDGKI